MCQLASQRLFQADITAVDEPESSMPAIPHGVSSGIENAGAEVAAAAAGMLAARPAVNPGGQPLKPRTAQQQQQPQPSHAAAHPPRPQQQVAEPPAAKPLLREGSLKRMSCERETGVGSIQRSVSH